MWFLISKELLGCSPRYSVGLVHHSGTLHETLERTCQRCQPLVRAVPNLPTSLYLLSLGDSRVVILVYRKVGVLVIIVCLQMIHQLI